MARRSLLPKQAAKKVTAKRGPLVRKKTALKAPLKKKPEPSVPENIVKTGSRYAIQKRLEGGIEFEFASKLSHKEFAKLLAQVVGVDLRTIYVSDSYISSHNNKDYTVWRVEADSSIDISGEYKYKIELVAPITPVKDLVALVPKIFELIEKHGKTNSSTGMHVTLSVPGKKMKTDLDVAKLLVLLNEQYYGEEFGRTDNDFAKLQIPSLIENVKSSNKYSTMRETIEHFVTKPYRIDDRVFPITKRTSINLSKADKNLIEFRLPGGTNYHKRLKLMQRVVWHFASSLAAATDAHAYLKDYVKHLIKLVEDARPSPGDPLLVKRSNERSKLMWLKKTVDGGIQWSLVDVTDGPVQKTRLWADQHLVIKLFSKINKETGAYELLGSGEGSGWNPTLIENVSGGTDNRRLARLREHALKNRHPYKRAALKGKGEGKDVKSNFWTIERTPSNYYNEILRKIINPASGLALPANHMARMYLGIDITPSIAEELLRNPLMIPYVSWYFSDLALRRRLREIPAKLTYEASRQKEAPAGELAELAVAYLVCGYHVPRSILIRVCKDKSVAEFTKTAYALMKQHLKDMNTASAKAFVEYCVLLAKFPSKQPDNLRAYEALYISKTKGESKSQKEWTKEKAVEHKASPVKLDPKKKVKPAPKPKPVVNRGRSVRF